MMMWEWWQWAVLITVNTIIAISYYYIPYKLFKNKIDGGDRNNIFLLSSFVIACGTHHLIHYWAMKASHEYPEQVFWVLFFVDGLTAFISLLAAKDLRFG